MEQVIANITTYLGTSIQSRIIAFSEFTPRIMGALAVLVFGLLFAELIGRIILAAEKTLEIDFIADKLGLKHFLERTNSKFKASEVIAKAVKGYLIFLFFIESTKIAGLTRVADFLSEVISYIPDLLIAIFIMLVGIRIGHTMKILITTSLSFARSNAAEALGIATNGIIITFAVLAALAQLNIAEILVQILFVGFVAMITIAGGLAFGLGGKDVVRELLENVKRVEIKKARKHKK